MNFVLFVVSFLIEHGARSLRVRSRVVVRIDAFSDDCPIGFRDQSPKLCQLAEPVTVGTEGEDLGAVGVRAEWIAAGTEDERSGVDIPADC